MSAKVSAFNYINDNSFGFAVLDKQIVTVWYMVCLMVYISHFLSQFTRTLAITLYEKSASKGARHTWTSKATCIGALSHIAVQCYEHIQSRQSPYCFHSMECVATRMRRFTLLPSLSFYVWSHQAQSNMCLEATSSKFDLDHSAIHSMCCYLNRILFFHRRGFSLDLLAGVDVQPMRLLKR